MPPKLSLNSSFSLAHDRVILVTVVLISQTYQHLWLWASPVALGHLYLSVMIWWETILICFLPVQHEFQVNFEIWLMF